LSHLGGQLTAAKKEEDEAMKAIVAARIDIVQTQLNVVATETLNAGEVVRNVRAATANERWK
jgi:hypothetical protein